MLNARTGTLALWLLSLCVVGWYGLMAGSPPVHADGKLQAPVMYKGQPYQGSLEETAQEAILIFTPGTAERSAVQDMILKIKVKGEVSDFGWVIPLCNPPSLMEKAEAALFDELHQYVQRRLAERAPRPAAREQSAGSVKATADAVEVIERRIVGSYDVAVVRERQPGTLNKWLTDNGYQPLEDADDVLNFYREKNYVYACVKVSEAELVKGRSVDMHPLHFRFETGGRDGIFFPMRLTGLQNDRFDLNLYIFYDKWINDQLSAYGYIHRGMTLRWRDFDTRQCTPNAGKLWSQPQQDPYMRNHARHLNTTSAFFKKYHPGQRFYLTNVYARQLNPSQVRQWADDLWFFPYYTNREMVPFDARDGGPAQSIGQHIREAAREVAPSTKVPSEVPPTR